MSSAAANLLRHVQHLADAHQFGSLSDRQLLERFATQRDEAAFALLVRRHGPMVLGMCRRALGHEQDTEDVFQAVFLILARKAAGIRQANVGGFLYRVAYRLAVRARVNAVKRLRRDRRAEAPSSPDLMAEVTWREVRQVVDEELQRLPEAPRSALVLCYLEVIHGRVLGPDGLPKVGAKLLLLGYEDQKVTELGTSLADGHFTLAIPKEARNHTLIAQADGTGIDLFNLREWKSGKPIELRLAKDQVIRGRIVNAEGKPCAGVRVAVSSINIYAKNSLDSFLAAWKDRDIYLQAP